MGDARTKGMIALLTLAFFGRTIYRPQPAVNLNSLAQARTQSDGKIRVTAAALSAEESRRIFDAPL